MAAQYTTILASTTRSSSTFPEASSTGTNPSADTSVDVGVHNEGMRDAADAIVGLYGHSPVLGTVPLAQVTVNVLAGGVRVANLNLDYEVSGFYVGVNVDEAIEERDISNNVVLVGQVPYRIYP